MYTLKNIKGLKIAITGTCWEPRDTIIKRIKKAGGIFSDSVTKDTNVLIRGYSEQWQYYEYGIKEEAAASEMRKREDIVVVDDDRFEKLLIFKRPIKVRSIVAGIRTKRLHEKISYSDYMKVAKLKGDLDSYSKVLIRKEQQYLRQILFGQSELHICDICGKRLPSDLLRAAHIKRRSECSLREKKDVKNIVFSACLIGCDALFELGYVGVNSKGLFKTTKKPLPKELSKVLRLIQNHRCHKFSSETKQYFDWHYKRIFIS